MQNMRLVMVSPRLPWPPTTGGQVRIAEIAVRLAESFDLTFIAPRNQEQELPNIDNIRFVCPVVDKLNVISKLSAFLHPFLPYHTAICHDRRLTRAIRQELDSGSYDVIYSHFIHPLVCLPRSYSAQLVVDQHNVDRDYWANKVALNRGLMKWFCRWNRQRTILFETRLLKMIWAFVSVSDDDRLKTMEYANSVVPFCWTALNGVDTKKCMPDFKRHADKSSVTLGYLGSMDIPMNIHTVSRFIRSILPNIRAKLINIETEFLVVGRNPAPSIRELAEKTPGIRLSGTVDNIVPWMHQVDILVAPILMGAGTKLKVAEALACGLPVVGTSAALAGLPGTEGVHYLQADNDDDFADAVCLLARSADKRASIGQAARKLAEEYLSWDSIVDGLAQNIQESLRF